MPDLTVTISVAALAHVQEALQEVNDQRAEFNLAPYTNVQYVRSLLKRSVRASLADKRRRADGALSAVEDGNIDADFEE